MSNIKFTNKSFLIPKKFDFNLLEHLNTMFSHEFHRDKNTMGCSATPNCERGTVLKKLHNIHVEGNPKMLIGSIMHEAIQGTESLFILIQAINEQLGIKGNTHIIPEEVLEYEVAPGKTLQGHIDISTNHYLLELKTTWTYERAWIQEIAPKYAIQLNTYLGIKGLQYGFIATINMRAFLNTFKSWKELWEKWGYIIPFEFQPKLFDATIDKVREIFTHIDNEDPNIFCAPMSWECGFCDVVKQCGKVEQKCEHINTNGKRCNKKMLDWLDCLMIEFKETPICENCYTNKTQKRKPYKLWKYSKQFPWL